MGVRPGAGTDPSEDEEGGGLRRDLTLLDIVAIYAGNILGSGIFVAPAAVAAAAPGGGTAAGLWILGGLLAACGAACYAECGVRLPRTGGFYVYYREVFGGAVAFVGGWAALLVTYPASIAAIALIFASYLREVVPTLTVDATIPAAAALLAVGGINIAGVRTSAFVQRILTSVKVAAVAAVCLAAMAHSESPAAPQAAAAGGDLSFTWAGLLTAVVVMLWTYDGWSDVSLVAGEIREPGRVLGRAVILGAGVMALLYTVVQIAVSALLTRQQAAASTRAVADAVRAGLGAGSGRVVAILVVVCTFGSIHGIILAASRAAFAMARDGAFFRWFGEAHPRFRSPARAVGALTAASVLYVFAAGFRNLLGFFSFSVWIFYALTAICLLVLRRRRIGEPAAWRTPGGPAAPIFLIATAAVMTTGLMIESPRRSLIGLGLLLAGFPVFAAWNRFWQPRPAAGG